MNMKMINLKLSPADLKKYSKFLVLAIIILLGVGTYFLWWPEYQEFNLNSENLSNKEEEIRLKKEYNRELEGNLNLLLDYDEEISKIGTALPQKFSIASLISFIQNKASENGLSLSEINPSAEVTSAVSESSAKKEAETVLSSGLIVKNASFNIVSSGTYSSFKNFLSSVWKNSRIVNISSINFSSPKEEAIGVFDFNLDITASYYVPEPSE